MRDAYGDACPLTNESRFSSSTISVAVNVVQSALSSPRFSRWLLWISVVVFAAGVATFLGVHFSNTANPTPKEATGPRIPPAVPQTDIPFPDAAWRVAREFVFTAVARKDLDRAYAITHRDLKGDIPLSEWRSGNLPNIVYSPAAQILKTNWKNTNYAHPRDAQINVVIIPKTGKPWNAQIGLTKVGKGSKAHWLVSYFSNLSGPPIPTHGG
jgi:hypothetical protein